MWKKKSWLWSQLTHTIDWKIYLTISWYETLVSELKDIFLSCNICKFNQKWVCTVYQKDNPWGHKGKERSCCHWCSNLWNSGCKTENIACMSYACNTALGNMNSENRKKIGEHQRLIETMLLQHWLQFTQWIRILKKEIMFLLVR